MRRTLLVSCFLASVVHAQHLVSVGVKGGVPLSNGFSDRTTTNVDTTLHSFSDSKEFVLGPMVELHLPLGLSIEADALYHPLSLVVDTRVLPSVNSHATFNVHSFEFPILGKYRFLHTPIVKPYVEAGPIFRTVGSDTSFLSNKGFAIGAGVDFKLLLVTVTPELRFSRWGSDSSPKGVAVYPSNQNQGQFLIGLSF